MVFSKSLTRTLEELEPTSEFLMNLNASPDPQVPYTLIAGNIGRIEDPQGAFERVVDKVDGWNLFRLLFRDVSHDTVVSTPSAKHIPGTRVPAPVKTELGCHHLNVLSVQQVLSELSGGAQVSDPE
jgi:hypothetical protein